MRKETKGKEAKTKVGCLRLTSCAADGDFSQEELDELAKCPDHRGMGRDRRINSNMKWSACRASFSFFLG